MANVKNDFSISIATKTDTSEVQKTLDRIQKKRPVLKIDLDIKQAERSMSNLNKRIAQLVGANNGIGEGFERINTKIKTGVTALDQYGKTIKNATVYTETFKNKLGDIKERMTVMTSGGQILQSNTEDIANGIEKISTSTSKSVNYLNGFKTTVTEVNKTMTDTAGNTNTVINKTSEWVDANNKLHKSVETLDENGNQLSTTTETVTDNIKKVGTTSQTSSKQVKSLGTEFIETIGKVAKFYLATIPIQAVQSAITDAIETVKEFDEALTEFRKVSDLSGESLDAYVEKLGELGTAVGRTTTDMVRASTEFKKSGFDDETSAVLAQTASLYQNIADEELSASDASTVLISQMKAFQEQQKEMEATDEEFATHIIDSINEVSNNYAVSSGDIGRGLTQAGAALSTYGNSFEETIGLVSAGTEIFQGKSQQVKFMSCLLNIA